MKRSAGLHYIRQVRNTLDDGKHKIFTTLLAGFGQGSISDTFLIDALTRLFSDHPLLLRGFQSYISPPTSLSNVNVPRRFNGDDNDQVVYKSFRDALTMCYGKNDHHKAAPPRSNVNPHPTTTTTSHKEEEDISAHQPPRKRIKFSEDVPPAQIQREEDVSAQIERATEFCNKVRRRFNDNDGVYESFLDALSTCYDRNNDHKAAALEVENELKLLFGSKKGKEFIDEEEKKVKKEVVERHPDLVLELAWFMADFKIKDEQDKEEWESVKYGNREESCSRSPKRKHPSIEMLHKLDDDQCEADILFHSLESTCNNLLNFIQKVNETEGAVVLEDFLSVINLRCIERVYRQFKGEDDYGQRVIELIRIDPIKAGQRVFRRLHEKLMEMKEERKKAREIWANARKKCHEKLEKGAAKSSRVAVNSSLEPIEDGKK